MARKRSEIMQELFGTMEITKRTMYAHLQHTLEKMSLGPTHVHMLMIIERLQPVQLKDLAAKMHLTPGAITQTLEVLFGEGYLRRGTDERDRRSVLVSLTGKGSRKVQAIKKMQQERFTQMTSGLTDAELELLLRMQQKMLDYLEHENNKEHSR